MVTHAARGDSTWLPGSLLPTAAELLRSDALDLLAPLVPPTVAQQLTRLATQLPLPVLNACCECWLGEQDTRVDLSMCMLPTGVGDVVRAFDSAPRAAEGWCTASSWMQAWNAFEADWCGDIPFVWLAFDLPELPERLPVPCLGLCVDHGLLPQRLGLPYAPSAYGSAALRIAQQMHPLLLGSDLSDAAGTRMQCLLQGQRGPIIGKHLSYMLSRAPRTFKLDVQLTLSQLEPCLTALRWPSPATIARRLGALVPGLSTLQLNLTLEPELRGPLEVELFTDPRSTDLAQRSAVLAALVKLGLCSEIKARALLRLLQTPCASSSASSWYLKLKLEDDVPSLAKAYVGFSPRFPRRPATDPLV